MLKNGYFPVRPAGGIPPPPTVEGAARQQCVGEERETETDGRGRAEGDEESKLRNVQLFCLVSSYIR